jgi:hypothetical protein
MYGEGRQDKTLPYYWRRERGKRIRHIIVKCMKNKRKRGKNKMDISKGTPRSLLALKTMGEI